MENEEGYDTDTDLVNADNFMVSPEEIEAEAAKFLEENKKNKPDFSLLTPGHLIVNKRMKTLLVARVRRAKETRFRTEKKETQSSAEQQIAEERRLEKARADAEAILASQHTLSAEELVVALQPAEMSFEEKLAASGQLFQTGNELPESVLEVKNTHGGKLPAMVFETADAAILFRAIAIGGIKRYTDILEAKDKDGKLVTLDPEYRDLVEYSVDRAKCLAGITSTVLQQGWGVEPRGSRAYNPNLYQEIKKFVQNDTLFAFLVNIVTVENFEQDKEALEQKELADKVRQNIKAEISQRLVKVGVGSQIADKRANNLVKKYYHQAMGNAVKILCLGAVNKTNEAETDEDRAVISQYVAAAGLSSEQFQAELVKAKDEQDKEKRRRRVFGWGEMTPQAEAARKAKKKGGDGGKKGGKNKR